ncbi:maltose alpha-D-glucosyltransferase [Nemorincola caseinilytica]|uniref:Maltokinase n=1 Tax=Nemorincola caseinilytica TaxID=2054315 RepID=A0ABP8NRI9_9BACT
MAKKVNNTKIDDDLHWYKDAVIYELHIKAFCDGNCDGIGDLEGLMTKLDHLQNLGITTIWLLPFYPSPLKDDGYDIADYYTINPAYGNLKQFKKLLKEAHNRGLKVITELVINHTSDQHPWFQKARRAPRGSKMREYYVWTDDPQQYKDTRIIFQDFESSNWTWDPVAGQYYWHRFFYHQPDLKYDNPAVQAEVFKMIDFWCGMGVDGFRLDAVPYLFEREGTNCENLPETHAFLKKLRRHVDKNYPGTLLLAEANMWPEDSANYFGNGDECHMNYHFPVMPRMYMALQMEDRYPITDIFDQTPAIPETCQWAMFLRNHDELTLEMVTDEERDYMYKVYVKDPKARINLGIRHRLAPLMGNDRKKIELLNYLLFSFQGTPVIYYGDEIGMGDNYYLGDRDGVRTPMQWTMDRNAGFSQANPQKLYLPIITDPLYHYEYVNVEIENRNTTSLLWFMKRLINTRKKYKAFSRGDMKFISSENAKVLAFTRTYEDETILIVVNLSRFAQPVELDLAEYRDHTLKEIFSGNRFPAIKGDAPYFFTLSQYECLWFVVEKNKQAPVRSQDLFTLHVNDRMEITEPAVAEDMAQYVLPAYMANMRWFGGKARTIQAIQVMDHVSIPVHGDDDVLLLLIEVSYTSGLPDIYQLPVAFAWGRNATAIKEGSPQAVICQVRTETKNGILYDAIYSNKYRNALFAYMSKDVVHNIDTGEELYFMGSKGLRQHARNRRTISSKVLSAEQSNSSVIYDKAYFFKLYRKVDRSINPDLEITRFLSEKTTFGHIPAFAGAIQWSSPKGDMVLGMMQEVVEENTDGWAYMLDKLDKYNERILSNIKAGYIEKYRTLAPVPDQYEQLPTEIQELLDTSVIERVRTLGIRTAEMHLALASSQDAPAFVPERFSQHYQRSLYSSFQSLTRRSFQTLARALKKLPDSVRAEAEELMGMKNAILERFKLIYQKKFDVAKIRIHGDYHLGQTLFTGKDVMIIDFEGEPARSYSERRLKRSALRDVAGMMRSFHYAAYGSLLLDSNMSKDDIGHLVPFAEQWQRHMNTLYLQAYLNTVRDTILIPPNMNELRILLDTYILEKAVYELNYELNNRPDWVIIPIRGIKAIMGNG